VDEPLINPKSANILYMKNSLRLFLYFLLLVQVPAEAQTQLTMVHNGINRNYTLYVPPSFSPGSSWPVVFVLHGFTQTAQSIMNYSGFNAIADTASFIVVYPDGVGNAWNTNSGMSGGSTADDIAYIGALTDTLFAQYGIDTTRVYSCGFSAGGYMSHRLACESSRCYAAIASVAGTMSTGAYAACLPSRPVPVMQIHGTSDFVVSYNGGFGGVSVADVISKWVSSNTCPPAAQVTAMPDLVTTDFSTVERSVYAPCAGSTEVILYKVNGGGHQWPGTTAIAAGIGTINRDIDASAVIWNFFRSRSCVSTTTAVVEQNEQQQFSIQADGLGGFIINANDYTVENVIYQRMDIAGRKVSEGVFVGSLHLQKQSSDSGVQLVRIQHAGGVSTLRLLFP
jgi:polyhydroxybutyrate depolymerase